MYIRVWWDFLGELARCMFEVLLLLSSKTEIISKFVAYWKWAIDFYFTCCWWFPLLFWKKCTSNNSLTLLQCTPTTLKFTQLSELYASFKLIRNCGNKKCQILPKEKRNAHVQYATNYEKKYFFGFTFLRTSTMSRARAPQKIRSHSTKH